MEIPRIRHGLRKVMHIRCFQEAYVKLIKELRVEFDKHGFLLTAAVAAGETSASLSYNIPALGT